PTLPRNRQPGEWICCSHAVESGNRRDPRAVGIHHVPARARRIPVVVAEDDSAVGKPGIRRIGAGPIREPSATVAVQTARVELPGLMLTGAEEDLVAVRREARRIIA